MNRLSEDLIFLIGEFYRMPYKPLVDLSEMDVFELSRNPRAIDYIICNIHKPNKVSLMGLCDNPAAINIICGLALDSWVLSRNPAAIDFLKANPERICWKDLSANPAAMDLIEKNLFVTVNWENLSINPAAIDVLLKYYEWVNWPAFSENPAAVPYLGVHRDQIYWDRLSANPAAIDLLAEQIEKYGGIKEAVRRKFLHLGYLSRNPNIFELIPLQELVQYPMVRLRAIMCGYEQISLIELSGNPAIFQVDHEKYKQRFPRFMQFCIKLFESNQPDFQEK